MSVDKKITVDELLVTPFWMRSEEEKSRIVAEGRPTPLIKASVLLTKETSQESVCQGKRNVYDELKLRHQKILGTTKSLYDDIIWLTASATTQRFYCWPCMLFQTPGVWNVSGISDISLLRSAAEVHKVTEEHVEAMSHYLILLDANVKKEDHLSEYGISDANVKRENHLSEYGKVNIDVIKRLTDVLSTLASIQLPPKKLKNRPSELDTEQCINSMQFLRKYDNKSKNDSDEAIDLLRNSPDILINLAKAIAKTMRQTIAREMDSCKYVSMIVNQHSNVKLKAQISTVLRYVVNGRVSERFVEFSHLFKNATVESLYTHIMRIAHEFNIESKCIALSLDGAVLYHTGVKKLLQPCQNKFPRLILVPWHSHTVDEVLQKSLSSAHFKLESFFKIMAEFNACFWNSNSEFNAAFDRFTIRSKFNHINISPRISSSDWFVAPDFICCVQKHRKHFVAFLKEAVSSDSKLNADDITKAMGLREYLGDLPTVFLLGFFSDLFCATSALNAALSDPSPERIVDDQIVPRLLRNLSAMKMRDFERLFADAVNEIGAEAPRTKETESYALFMAALNIVIGEVKMRYSDVDKFKFCRLFDFEEGGWFEETSNRHKDLTQVYKTAYDIPQTLCEMELISKNDAFSKKSVYDFHQYLHESNFKHALGALFDFSELILALPYKPTSSTKELSIRDKIDKWSFGSAEEPHYEDISIIFVESEDLLRMKQSSTFYDQVLANMRSGPDLGVLPQLGEI